MTYTYEPSPYKQVGLSSRAGRVMMTRKIPAVFSAPAAKGGGHSWPMDFRGHTMAAVCRRCRKPRFIVEGKRCKPC